MRRQLILILFISVMLFSCGNNSDSERYTAVVEGTLIRVPALVGGKIIALNVNAGDQVQVDDTLAVIDTTDLVLQRDQLKAALKQVRIQQDIARTNLERARSDLAYARDNYQRTKTLVEKQSIPRQNLDDVKNKLQRVEAMYQTAQQQLENARAQEQQVKAQLNSILKKISDAILTSPINGVVSEKYFELFEAVPPLKPVVEILDHEEMETKIYISEKKLPHVRPGQSVTVRIDGLDETLDGTISRISSKAEFTPKQVLTPETRTSLVYGVTVRIPNTDYVLKHGMPVEVIL